MGVYTRYLIRQHVWRIVVAAGLVLAIIMPIHVGAYVDDTWRAAAGAGRSGLAETAVFVGLRAADVLAQIFPIAFVLAVLWSEMSLSLSGRRLMTRVAGRSLAAGLPALFIVAGGSVVTQFLLDNYARPHSVLSLVERQLGTYRQYVANETGAHGAWLAVGDDILQAGSFDRTAHAFGKVTLYRFAADRTLREVLVAERAFPQARDGGFAWILEDGFRADITEPGQAEPEAGAPEQPKRHVTRFASQAVDLAIDPLWVQFRGFKPMYLPLSDLARLARLTAIPADQPDYLTALHLRFSKALVPGLVCVLVIATFLVGSARQSTPVAAGIGLAAAYLGIIASGAVGVLGQGRYVSGPVAAWLSPLLLLVLCAFVVGKLLRMSAMPEPATLPRAGQRPAARPGTAAAAPGSDPAAARPLESAP